MRAPTRPSGYSLQTSVELCNKLILDAISVSVSVSVFSKDHPVVYWLFMSRVKGKGASLTYAHELTHQYDITRIVQGQFHSLSIR